MLLQTDCVGDTGVNTEILFSQLMMYEIPKSLNLCTAMPKTECNVCINEIVVVRVNTYYSII